MLCTFSIRGVLIVLGICFIYVQHTWCMLSALVEYMLISCQSCAPMLPQGNYCRPIIGIFVCF